MKQKKTIGMRIREARTEKGMTKKELSAQSGVTAVTIINLEYNRHNPSFATMAKIADALDVSLDWFALGIEDKNNG